MNRRSFLISSSSLTALFALGCDNKDIMNNQYSDIKLPEFSSENLHELLNSLLSAYEQKDMKVSESLLPGLSEGELREKLNWFPGEVTPELISLYGWRGGQEKDAWESEFPFWFRDNSFCSIERAESEYRSMMDSYGSYPEDHELLKYSFPFASFNGGWYILPTKGQSFSTNLKAPIISVMQGIDIHYFSIEQMVRTCIEWVQHEEYGEDYTLPEEIEIQIWQKYNQGIFNS